VVLIMALHYHPIVQVECVYVSSCCRRTLHMQLASTFLARRTHSAAHGYFITTTPSSYGCGSRSGAHSAASLMNGERLWRSLAAVFPPSRLSRL